MHPIKIPNYRWLLLTRTIATLSGAFYTVPFMWWAVEENGSGTLAAAIGLVGALASLIVAPWGGVLADRGHKKQIIQITYFLDMVLLSVGAVLIMTGQLQVISALILSMFSSAISNLRVPAMRALTPSLIPREGYQRGAATMELFLTSAGLVSYPLAGMATAFVGNGPGIFVGVGLLALASLSLLLIREPQKTQNKTEKPTSTGTSLLTGFKYLFSNHFLVSVLVVSTLLNVILAPLGALAAPYVKSLGGNAAHLGLFSTALLAGQLIGLVLANFASERVPVAILMAGSLGIALGIGGLALAPSVYVAMGCLALGGLAAAVMNVQFEALLQLVVPEELMGRIAGAVEAVDSSVRPAGYAAVGLLLGVLSPREIFGVMGGLLLISSLAWLHPAVKSSLNTTLTPASVNDLTAVSADD